MKFNKPPSCLDAAYEREALLQGFSFQPVFPENRVCVKEERLTPESYNGWDWEEDNPAYWEEREI